MLDIWGLIRGLTYAFYVNYQDFLSNVMSGLIWIQTIYKGYQQMTIAAKSLNLTTLPLPPIQLLHCIHQLD